MPLPNQITSSQGTTSSSNSSEPFLPPRRQKSPKNSSQTISVYNHTELPKNATVEDVLRIGQQLQDQFHNLIGGGGVVRIFPLRLLLLTILGIGKLLFSIT